MGPLAASKIGIVIVPEIPTAGIGTAAPMGGDYPLALAGTAGVVTIVIIISTLFSRYPD
jgi:hypothetical protein